MPQILNTENGTPFRVTTSGLTALSGNLNLLGVWVASVLTAQIATISIGSTAGGPLLIGTSTLALNAFYRLPAYCSGGLSLNVTNEDVDLTLFWNPAAK